MGKHPKAVISLVVQKGFRAVEARTYNNECPSSRVRHIEFVDPYGWHTIGAAELLAIRERLSHFESMTWNEILVRGKKFNHTVSIADITAAARRRLSESMQGRIDIDELVSLRLSARERVWGIRDQAVLSLLWWDPAHAVCPSLKG